MATEEVGVVELRVRVNEASVPVTPVGGRSSVIGAGSSMHPAAPSRLPIFKKVGASCTRIYERRLESARLTSRLREDIFFLTFLKLFLSVLDPILRSLLSLKCTKLHLQLFTTSL